MYKFANKNNSKIKYRIYNMSINKGSRWLKLKMT